MNTYKRHRFPRLRAPQISSVTPSGCTTGSTLVTAGVPDHSSKIMTDKLRSYGVAHRELIPETIHVTERYANNRAEPSHEATRSRERGMRRFKSVRQAQQFLGAHAAVHNLFNLGRHLVSAEYYRNLRSSAFGEWGRAAA